MIQNERQYKISKAKRLEFISALEKLKAQPSHSGLKHQIQQQSLISQIEEFDQQIARYEYLISADALFESLHQIERLPELLIELRIAAKLNHKALGELLGIHEEQIRRYEANGYGAASLERILMIFEVCRERIRESPPSSQTGYTKNPPFEPPAQFYLN